jgi:nitronate monooxygenase
MAISRRKFLKIGAIAGATLDVSGVSTAARSRHASSGSAMPTSRAKALMALFKLDYPIFQAPHGPAATNPSLAAAVANAGALGALALTRSTPQAARAAVSRTRELTKRSFLVNYLLAFDPVSLPEALDAGAPVVQFSWGLPTEAMMSAARTNGTRVGVMIGNAKGARAALDLGADYLVCQGTEAGGHVQSSTPLYELLPAILDEAKDVPVLAAGGIAHGQAIRKALLAGASGTVLGTRFVATQESLAHPDYEQELLKARAKDTALSVCFQDGWPGATHRALRNGTFVRWEAAGCPPVGKRPGEGDVLATHADGSPVTRYNNYTPGSDLKGSIAELVMYAGEGVGEIRDLPSAGELVRRLWTECLDMTHS